MVVRGVGRVGSDSGWESWQTSAGPLPCPPKPTCLGVPGRGHGSRCARCCYWDVSPSEAEWAPLSVPAGPGSPPGCPGSSPDTGFQSAGHVSCLPEPPPCLCREEHGGGGVRSASTGRPGRAVGARAVILGRPSSFDNCFVPLRSPLLQAGCPGAFDTLTCPSVHSSPP